MSAEVTEDEAWLVRLHREAGRLAVALVRDPFASQTVTRLEDWLAQAYQAAGMYQQLCGRDPGMGQRIARLAQLAVDARPGGEAA